MTYRMIAKRNAQKVTIDRESSLLLLAKARVWTSEGWNVVITGSDGMVLNLGDLERASLPKPKKPDLEIAKG